MKQLECSTGLVVPSLALHANLGSPMTGVDRGGLEVAG
jgi:hypothetical protein